MRNWLVVLVGCFGCGQAFDANTWQGAGGSGAVAVGVTVGGGGQLPEGWALRFQQGCDSTLARFEALAPAACSPCQCGAPTGAGCTTSGGKSLTVFSFADAACAKGSAPDVTLSTPGKCYPSQGGPFASLPVPTVTTPEAATCAASGGALVAPEPASKPYPLCEAGTGAACVEHPGAVACPAGYPERRELWGEPKDGRACTECHCGAPIGLECTRGKATAYPLANCQGAGVQLGPACSSTIMASVKLEALPELMGSCSPSGGEAQGTVTADAYTLCCPVAP